LPIKKSRYLVGILKKIRYSLSKLKNDLEEEEKEAPKYVTAATREIERWRPPRWISLLFIFDLIPFQNSLPTPMKKNRYLFSKLQDDLDKYVTVATRRRRTAVEHQKEEEQEFFFLILDRYSSSLRRHNVSSIGERIK